MLTLLTPSPTIHPALREIPMPAAIKRLPLDARGFPVPKFVAIVEGVPDHRVCDHRYMATAVQEQRCWICGEKLGRYLAFLLGPMCSISRTVSEPPSHRDCATYAAHACPFLSRPYARRRESGLPEAAQDAAGLPIDRNPGCVCVWITRTFTPFRAFAGNGGVLFEVGAPTETTWWCEGRRATRAEVLASIESGLPILAAEAEKQGDEGRQALAVQVHRAMAFLPEE